ncbi:hypothetical protein Clacol_005823 [Clathrus columnatus]|uniref:carboxypeptidase C n=1 Tax=Clathrus columnatus TaxID=1419009 RepID=A0AAV5AEN3_9AGAM|nr:hypothetical protein Clacol_005823 [Clathrus columnatus]
MTFHALLVVLVGATSVIASQFPLNSNSNFATYDTGLFNQVDDIRTLSTNGYTTLTHPIHPQYSVRIKQNGAESCDNSVKSYTGYIDIEARHLFFSFFESRNDPSKDDVVLWTNGGPGCSSSLGLYMELGPCRIQSDNSTVYNPYAWNEKVNIFFIDQPVGVGFSYAEYGEAVGRYIPTFGARIADDNKRAVLKGLEPINLVSLIIGNGMTDTARMATSYYDIQCTSASVPAFQDIADCVRMKRAIPRCEALIQASCVDIYDEMNCRAAFAFCGAEFEAPFQKTGRNTYDVSKDCEGDRQETLCYPITKTISNYLNRPEVRTELGVDPIVGNHSSCSTKVQSAFVTTNDLFAEHAEFYVAELLERNIKVLIYVGTYDMICNWIGNERFTLNLEWTGREQFASQKLRNWIIDGHPAGKTRGYGGLTFATVEGAGHMVPYDKPAEALTLISRWVDDEEL